MSDPVETTSPESAWNPAETYKRNDPVGWGGDKSRGAAMGRNDTKDIPEDYEAPGFIIHVERILLIEGYDPLGTYWGDGGPLFWIYAREGDNNPDEEGVPQGEYYYLDYCERFVDLEDAVRVVKETWPAANVIGSEAWCDELVEKFLDEEREREHDEEIAELEACAHATLHPDEDTDYDVPDYEILLHSVSKPPSLDQSIWDALIERVRLSQNVCERLMRIEMASGASESIDTGAVCELFEDASKVTGIELTNKYNDEGEDDG